MSDLLPLTYGGFTYLDRTLPLQTGEVSPAGIELNYVTIAEIGALFRRMAQFAEFDAAEMSLSTLMLMTGRGTSPLVGIPVFPSRSFRHAFIFVGDESGIDAPADLKGKRIGVQDYQATAYVWIRALLEHEYGVRPQDMTWYVGGLDIVVYQHRLRHQTPPGVEIRTVPPGRTVEDMLRAGELDAVMTPEELVSTTGAAANWHRLFPDHQQLEREYFARTGIFPIMHTVVLRRDVYEANPWVALALLEAFEQAKALSRRRMADHSAPALTLPFLQQSLAELDQVFGGDAFPFGVEANRGVLDALTQYSFEQGLSPRRLQPDELFAPETLDYEPES